MEITPDAIKYWTWKFIDINATLVNTWVVIAVILFITYLSTRKLSGDINISKWQSMLEAVISVMRNQVREIIHDEPDKYLPFLGTLFLFISISNLLAPVPGYHPPTSSITTTGALALCVFFAVPVYGIWRKGLKGFLKYYIQPSVFMLPFNIIGEFSRTLAMAVRLFGNVMSGSLIAAILISIIPYFVPVIMELLELLIGQIQAYIFSVLAAVYIGSAARVEKENNK